jgi:hypothetical protein
MVAPPLAASHRPEYNVVGQHHVFCLESKGKMSGVTPKRFTGVHDAYEISPSFADWPGDWDRGLQ